MTTGSRPLIGAGGGQSPSIARRFVVCSAARAYVMHRGRVDGEMWRISSGGGSPTHARLKLKLPRLKSGVSGAFTYETNNSLDSGSFSGTGGLPFSGAARSH